MKKLITSLALASQLLIWEPWELNDDVFSAVENSKSDTSNVLIQPNVPSTKNAYYLDEKYSEILNRVLNSLENDIIKEFDKSWIKFFEKVVDLCNNNSEYIFENTILESSIREKWSSEFLGKYIQQDAEKKYGDELYDTVNKHVLYLLVSKMINWDWQANLWDKSKYYELNEETISFFKQMWITLDNDIEKYKNFRFIKAQNEYFLISNIDNNIIEVWNIEYNQVIDIHNKLLRIIWFVTDRAPQKYTA